MELADKAQIAPQTAYKAFNGDSLFRCKLKDIAEALRVGIGDVLHPSDPESTSPNEKVDSNDNLHSEKPSARTKVILTLTIEGDGLTVLDSDLAKTLNRFLSLIESPTDEEPLDIRFGSIYVTIPINSVAASTSFISLSLNHLSDLGITAITIHLPVVARLPLDELSMEAFILALHSEYNKVRADDGLSERSLAEVTPLIQLLTVIRSLENEGKLQISSPEPDQLTCKPTIPVLSTHPVE